MEVAYSGEELGQPNGIAWNDVTKQLVIAPLEGECLLAWRPCEREPVVVGCAAGAFDGLELLGDGSALVLCLDAGTIEHVRRDGRTSVWLTGLELPGNFAIDTRRNRLAIPCIAAGRVEAWAWSSSQ